MKNLLSVVVFVIGEAAQGDGAGVSSFCGRREIKGALDPMQQRFPLGLRRLRRLARRHVSVEEAARDIGEDGGFCKKGSRRGQAREVEVVVLGGFTVAFSAGFHKKRMDPLVVGFGQLRVAFNRNGGGRACEKHRE